VLVDTLGNDLVELHRRALADDKHDDRVAPAREMLRPTT
jgi:hypothetical protein